MGESAEQTLGMRMGFITAVERFEEKYTHICEVLCYLLSKSPKCLKYVCQVFYEPLLCAPMCHHNKCLRPSVFEGPTAILTIIEGVS